MGGKDGNETRPGRSRYVPGEWIVRYSDDPQAMSGLPAPDFWDLGHVPLAPALVDHLYLVPEQSLLHPALDGLKRKEVYRHRNYYLKPAATTVEPPCVDFPRQWSLNYEGKPLSGKFGTFVPEPGADIDAPRAWGIHKGDPSFVVAIIDSGLSPEAKELDANLWRTRDGVGKDFVDGGSVTSDSSGHGTRVASIIGSPVEARTIGVLWRCRMMPLRVFSVAIRGRELENNTTVDLVIRALDFAKQHGVRVSNNSYGAEGIDDAQGLIDAIREIGAQPGGHLFVCAAGNNRRDLDREPFYPASFRLPNMITVTSSAPDGGLGIARGVGEKTVHLAAPGENIWARANYDYGLGSGTSFATAHVSGAVALVWSYLESQGRQLSPAGIKDLLRRSVRKGEAFRGKTRWGGALELGKLLALAEDESKHRKK